MTKYCIGAELVTGHRQPCWRKIWESLTLWFLWYWQVLLHTVITTCNLNFTQAAKFIGGSINFTVIVKDNINQNFRNYLFFVCPIIGFLPLSIPSSGCTDHSVYVHSKWEMVLRCNGASHWLGAYTEWSHGRCICTPEAQEPSSANKDKMANKESGWLPWQPFDRWRQWSLVSSFFVWYYTFMKLTII